MFGIYVELLYSLCYRYGSKAKKLLIIQSKQYFGIFCKIYLNLMAED